MAIVPVPWVARASRYIVKVRIARQSRSANSSVRSTRKDSFRATAQTAFAGMSMPSSAMFDVKTIPHLRRAIVPVLCVARGSRYITAVRINRQSKSANSAFRSTRKDSFRAPSRSIFAGVSMPSSASWNVPWWIAILVLAPRISCARIASSGDMCTGDMNQRGAYAPIGKTPGAAIRIPPECARNADQSRCLPRNRPTAPGPRSCTRTTASDSGRGFPGSRNAVPERSGS